MKVICIKKTIEGDPTVKASGLGVAPKDSEVIEGETYTVIDQFYSPLTKMLVYRLAEKDYSYRYGAHKFIPLSSIDETEFERNYNTQTA